MMHITSDCCFTSRNLVSYSMSLSEVLNVSIISRYGVSLENIIPVDVTNALFNISDDKTVSACPFNDDSQKNLSGLNVGIISMETDPPHGGEVHFGGD
jgi:hypothetical protein